MGSKKKIILNLSDVNDFMKCIEWFNMPKYTSTAVNKFRKNPCLKTEDDLRKATKRFLNSSMFLDIVISGIESSKTKNEKDINAVLATIWLNSANL